MTPLFAKKGKRSKHDNVGNCDIFSYLPEHIIHHIFSFLDMNDIGRVGVVSKRCRRMFMSCPYLKFVSTCLLDGPSKLCEQFSDRVDRILSLRNGSKIQSLCLHLVCSNGDCSVDVNLVKEWINIAINCGVEELDFDIGIKDGSLFQIPQCIFSSISIRVLKLCMDGSCELKNPRGVFVSLEELSLQGMKISDKSLKKWISTACPSLKRLTVSSVVGLARIRIIHPFLEELTLSLLPYNLQHIKVSAKRLQKLSLDLRLHSDFFLEMRVGACSIKDLRLTTSAVFNHFFSNFKYLQNAAINVCVSDLSIKSPVSSHCSAELLKKVRWVRELQIGSDILEALLYHNNFPRVKFNNLRRLVVTNRNSLMMGYHFIVLASILVNSPYLEALCLKLGNGEGIHSHRKNELITKAETFYNRRFQSLIADHPLKEIRIERHGEKVVKNVLKFGKGLKKMTVFCSPSIFKWLSNFLLEDPEETSESE